MLCARKWNGRERNALVAQERNVSLPKSLVMSWQFFFQFVQSSVSVTVLSPCHMGGFVGGLLAAICAKTRGVAIAKSAKMKKNRTNNWAARGRKFMAGPF